MNYGSGVSTSPPLTLPVSGQNGRGPSLAEPIPAPRPSAERRKPPRGSDPLVLARNEVIGAQIWENLVWFALGISALALLVLSFW